MSKRITKISFRDVKSYLGNAYHEDIPYPSNPTVPENGDPFKFAPFGDSFNNCPQCKVQLIKQKGEKGITSNDVSNYVCPTCDARFSHKRMDGRERGKMSMTPGTLNWDAGSNTNNEAGGVFYHSEPYANQDTFSGNLGN